MNNETFIGQNDKAKFFNSSMTKTLTDHAVKSLGKHYRVVIAELNTGRRNYILVFKDKPIYETPVAEDMSVHIDIERLIQKGGKGDKDFA